jgi:hypothetical protein
MKYLILLLLAFANFAFACVIEPVATTTSTTTTTTAPTTTTTTAVVVAAPARWIPAPGTTWQWQLQGTIDTTVNVQMYNIDMVDVPTSTIALLKSQGKKVVCYFSAGSWEEWRPDAASFPASVKGNSNGWPGEKWLDIRQVSVLQPIMEKRLDLAVAKGCDGVEPDNIDGYTNNTGFTLTGNQQLVYNKMLAQIAHARNLSIGLKNDVDQIASLVNDFDFAINEQCYQYKECSGYSAFVNQGKAVFGVEYQGDPAVFCPKAKTSQFSWMKKKLDLGVYRLACPV